VLYHLYESSLLSEEPDFGESDWEILGAAQPQSEKTTFCNGHKLLGGPNLLKNNLWLSRIFDLTQYPHQTISLTFNLFLFDFWDGESLLIYLDDVLVKKITPNSRTDHFVDICGNYTYDHVEVISMDLRQINKTLTLKIVQALNNVEQKASRSWGIDRFKLSLYTQCQINSELIDLNTCRCRKGFFRARRENTEKKGYNGNFNYECRPCPYPSLDCTETEGRPLKCIEGYKLHGDRCILSNGKNSF
jgi:hypothetical protein